MFRSLKVKIIVPIVGLLIFMIGFIFLQVSAAVTNLADYLTYERTSLASRTAEAQLANLEEKTEMAALSAASSHTIVMNLQNWNANPQGRLSSRQAMVAYLQSAAIDIGIDCFVVRNAQGFVILRLHNLDLHGDHDGSMAVAASMRGETTTSYFSTAMMPMVLNTTTPIWSGGEIIGTITSMIFLYTDEFVDRFARIFGADVSVFGGISRISRIATTLLTENNQRAIGTTADANVIEEVLGEGWSLMAKRTLFGKRFHVHYMPLFDVSGTPAGIFSVAFSNERALNATDAVQRNLLVIGVSSLVLVAVMMLMFIMRMLKPINLLTHTLGSTANGDLTKRLPETGKDEIAMASRSFNLTMRALGEMIGMVKKQSEVLFDIGNDLASNMAETASAMDQITSNIHGIKSRVLNQSVSVAESNASMEQVTVNINKLSYQIEHQTGAVSQASSSIEEMLANIHSVSDTLAINVENVRDLQESSQAGKSSLQEVVSDIKEIARESESLLEINSVMENIASQTNLLSMNAAIEAAHAGSAGRGFAVVAGEIRKLAESSSERSKTIGDVLKKVKKSVDKITHSTGNVLGKFEAIDRSVKTVAEQEEAIRRAMDEQNRGSKQVLHAAGQVSEITQQVKGESLEMLEGSKEVIYESKNLEKVTREITTGMNEMAAGAEQVNVSVNYVNEISVKTREGINSLLKEVSRFKV